MFFVSSRKIMIPSTLNLAAARPIKPTFEVFSRRCGVSETTDAGIAMEILKALDVPSSLLKKCQIKPAIDLLLKSKERYNLTQNGKKEAHFENHDSR